MKSAKMTEAAAVAQPNLKFFCTQQKPITAFSSTFSILFLSYFFIHRRNKQNQYWVKKYKKIHFTRG